MTRLAAIAVASSLAFLGACEGEHVIDPGVRPPTADAGPDQQVTDDDDSGWEAVVLDGSASRPGDYPSGLGFRWDEEGSSLRGITLDSGRTFYANFSVGLHVVRLTVSDGAGRQSVDFVLIDVVAPDPTSDPPG